MAPLSRCTHSAPASRTFDDVVHELGAPCQTCQVCAPEIELGAVASASVSCRHAHALHHGLAAAAPNYIHARANASQRDGDATANTLGAWQRTCGVMLASCDLSFICCCVRWCSGGEEQIQAELYLYLRGVGNAEYEAMFVKKKVIRHTKLLLLLF